MFGVSCSEYIQEFCRNALDAVVPGHIEIPADGFQRPTNYGLCEDWKSLIGAARDRGHLRSSRG